MIGIKKMLVGIAVIVVVIAFHLFLENPLATDFFVIVGVGCVVGGFLHKNE